MRKPRPYVMRGQPVPTAGRPTVIDRPDRRVEEVRPRKLSADQIRIINREGATDPRLRPIDRCFERWAVTPGDGLVSPGLSQPVMLFRTPQSQPSPLDDAESKLIDVAVRSSPAWASSFIRLWYRSDHTVTDIMRILLMKRRESVYTERHLVLGYYLGRLSEAGLRMGAEA